MSNYHKNIGDGARVYVAGPLTVGDQDINVRNACKVAEVLITHNFVPFVPHLFRMWHLAFPHAGDYWLDLDGRWLTACDLMIVLPGPTAGGIHFEREICTRNNIPFYDLGAFYGKYGVYLMAVLETVVPIEVKI